MDATSPIQTLLVDLKQQRMQEELVAAGIFVRVYNEQPSFVLGHEEATAFCKGIVTWISVFSRKESFCTQAGEGIL